MKREIQQWMHCITSVKEQFDVRFVIKAPLIRWQGINMFTCCLLQVLVMLSFSGIICALQEKLVYIYCVEKKVISAFITAISAARLILCGHKHDHFTPLLKELHWLSMEQRIIFKILLLTFKYQ